MRNPINLSAPGVVLMSVLLAAIAQCGGSQQAHESLSPYARWANGPARKANEFPIAVWLQDPSNAARYKAAGFNLYVALWEGPTEAQLTALKTAGMPVICAQNAVGLAHRTDPTIVGWMHGDEPDNAQAVTDPATGKQSYGPCIPPDRIVADYARIKAQDPTRPILLNLGQGVANDAWVGRGPGAKLEDYATYVNGGDLVSFDVYPVAGLDRPDSADFLWYVPKGVDRLTHWTGGRKPIWNCIECTRIGGDRKPTPHQVRAEVWMALIHGSRGLIYFVHEFKPKFDEHALLDDPEMLAEVTAINRQIEALAPLLNSPTLDKAATVQSSSPATPIDIMAKRHGQELTLCAVGMRNAATTGTFTVPGAAASATVEVLGEGRTLTMSHSRFTDTFHPYDVHLYRLKVAR